MDEELKELRRVLLAEIKALRKELRLHETRLLSVSETAQYCGIAEKTIRNMLGRKAAKPFPVRPVRVAGRVLFRKIDLDKFIDALPGE